MTHVSHERTYRRGYEDGVKATRAELRVQVDELAAWAGKALELDDLATAHQALHKIRIRLRAVAGGRERQ